MIIKFEELKQSNHTFIYKTIENPNNSVIETKMEDLRIVY